MKTRLPALLATEWRVGRRYRIPGLVLGLALPWSALALVLPATAPYLLFVETATVGTWIVGALTVTDRSCGVAAALSVSPVRPVARVAARIAPLVTLTVLAGVPVMIAGRAQRHLSALAALALTAVLLLGIGLGIAARRRDLIGYLTVLPWPLVPLLAVPLAVATGLLTGPGWYAVPTTGSLDLLRAGFAGRSRYPAAGLLIYLAAAAVLACAYAAGALARPDAARPHRTAPDAVGPVRLVRRPRWMSFLRADIHNIARDSILVPIALSPLLLGAALRFGYPPLSAWLRSAHGVDLASYRPVLALLAVVLHIPVIAGMTGALLVLDDRDSGALDVIRVSPLGVRRYLAYRLGLVTAFTLVGLAVAAPLSGVVPASAWAALVLAVPTGPLYTAAILAAAGSRIEGVGAAKALGVPAYAPLAGWWLTGPVGWLFAPLPGYWVVQAWDGPPLVPVAAGLVCSALWLAVLTRRTTTRI